MKFGHSLILNLVAEWSDSYIDYKALKRLIKKAAEQQLQNASSEPASEYSGHEAVNNVDYSTEFFYALDRNADLVETFFCIKFAEYSRRLSHITMRYSLGTTNSTNSLDGDELRDVVGLLLEIRSKLRKLQWYAEVNKQGFFKILKKYDKKVGTHSRSRYFSSKILVLSFANTDAVADLVALSNRCLNQLAPELQHHNGSGSEHSSLKSAPQSPRSRPQANDSLREAEPELVQAMVADDSGRLLRLLTTKDASQKLRMKLLMYALAGEHEKSVRCILSCSDNLQDPDDIDHRNIIHQLIIRAGRDHCDRDVMADIRMHHGAGQKGGSFQVYCHELDIPGAAEAALKLLLKCLVESQHSVVAQPDQLLRTPLHYAARYGLPRVAALLLEYYEKWQFVDSQKGLGLLSVEWCDSEKQTPVALAVEGRHSMTTRTLLEMGVPRSQAAFSACNPLLLKAARLNSVSLLEALLDFGANIDYQDPRTGESALYMTTKFQYETVVLMLLERKADVSIAEFTFGWTPLFVAAVDGQAKIAQMLLDSGAPGDIRDLSGWTPKEHAVLRGHVTMAKIFPPAPLPEKDADWKRDDSPENDSVSPPVNLERTLQQRLSTRKGSTNSSQDELVKTFGHNYLADPSKYVIIISLGSKDIRCKNSPVELEQIPLSMAGESALDTALSLKVSATNCGGVPPVVDIMTSENEYATEPYFFYTSNPGTVQLFFDLVPRYKPCGKPLGRAVALVSTIIKKIGLSRANLDTTLTLPIIEAESLRVIGSVTFDFMVVSPFVHPNAGVGKSSTYWRSLITTRLIGHRGLGKNTTSKNSLQLGENTIESFIQAANLGASYVEFDVQLTRDLVPVIYHDFVVSDSGFDIPMHELTLEQFMNIHGPPGHLRQAKSRVSERRASTSSLCRPKRTQSMLQLSRQSRATSEPASESEESEDESDTRGMRLTRDFRAKGYKGNVRGHSIQSKFATLEELFRTLPAGVGFNIECKYPMMDECETEGIENVGIDLNTWVDVVLKCVYDNKGSRDIIFSSFHPDVCVLLSLKQPSIPVLFLTEGGTASMMDVRASSLQEAIRFSRCWNLLGIVSESTPLIECPRLVSVIKKNGLVCFTYGTANNEPENARRQLKAGVDAVIVDSVLRVRKDLTAESKAADVETTSYISAYTEENSENV